MGYKDYIPKEYYEVEGDFGLFKAKWQDEKGNNKIENPAYADAIKFKCVNTEGRIIKILINNKEEERPLLYNLNELKKEAYRRYGIISEEVYKIADDLYKIHKIITYPKTNSRYLSDDMIDHVKSILKIIKERNILRLSNHAEKILIEGPNIDKRVIDNNKITDYHAIIPTDAIIDFDFSKLSEKEKKIFLLIETRLLITLSKPHIYESKEIIASVDTIDGIELFGVKRKRVINNAWKDIEESIFNNNDNNKKEKEELQDLKPLQKIQLGNTEVLKHTNSKEIIGICPRCGKNIFEGPKNFYCEGYKEDPRCKFSIFKNNRAFSNRGKNITANMAKQILKDGKIIIKGLKSKAGNEYNALFTMKDDGQYVNFEVKLVR